jgi:hypothetical protein
MNATLQTRKPDVPQDQSNILQSHELSESEMRRIAGGNVNIKPLEDKIVVQASEAEAT